jgi:hypothetical protein
MKFNRDYVLLTLCFLSLSPSFGIGNDTEVFVIQNIKNTSADYTVLVNDASEIQTVRCLPMSSSSCSLAWLSGSVCPLGEFKLETPLNLIFLLFQGTHLRKTALMMPLWAQN